jgi:hypothetical protein
MDVSCNPGCIGNELMIYEELTVNSNFMYCMLIIRAIDFLQFPPGEGRVEGI